MRAFQTPHILSTVPARVAGLFAMAALVALSLGASRARSPEGVTLCTNSQAAMQALAASHFAAHPAHGGAPASPASTKTITATVQVVGNTFVSNVVTINQFESVQFNGPGGIAVHTVTSGLPSDLDAGSLFDLPIDSFNPTQVITFNTAGTFNYFCQFHSFLGMTGSVIVNPTTSTPPNGRPGAGFVAAPWPNPTRDAIAMRFAVPGYGRTRLAAFDAGGRQVATIFDRDVTPGTYSAQWAGRTDGGGRLGAGTYFVRLIGPGVRETRQVTLLR